jgi:hypothetical protein
VIRPLRPQPDAGSVVEPQTTARFLLGRDLQSFPPPDALDPVSAHVPASLLQQGRDPPVAVAAILTGQGDDRLGQLVFVVPLRWLIALGSPRLPYQPAGVPFTQSLVPSVLDGDAAPLGT